MNATYLNMMLDVVWLLFLIFLWHHFWQKRRFLLDAQGWLKTKGRIIECEVVQEGRKVWPKIVYQYQIQDSLLQGHYLFLDTAHNNPNSQYARQVAYDAVIAFQKQSLVDVYYNPNKPEESALNVAMPKKLSVILILIGLLLFAQIVKLLFLF